MNELFTIEPSESPKIKWMKRNHISINKAEEANSQPYFAYHGMKYICQASAEDDCLVLAAKRLNLKLWNEE